MNPAEYPTISDFKPGNLDIDKQKLRIKKLKAELKKRILILDGALGTMIQKQKLGETEFRGEKFCNTAINQTGNMDLLTLSQPSIVTSIHRDYLESNADIIKTNTFSSTRVAQYDFGMDNLAYSLNYQAAVLARKVADEITETDPARQRFVAGVLGPTNRTASITPDINNPMIRNITFDEFFGH